MIFALLYRDITHLRYTTNHYHILHSLPAQGYQTCQLININVRYNFTVEIKLTTAIANGLFFSDALCANILTSGCAKTTYFLGG